MDRSPAFRTIFILLQIYTDSLGRNLRGLSERFPLLEPDFQPLSWSPNRCFGKNKWVFDPFLSFFPACPVSFLYEDLYRDLKRARNKWRKTRFPPGAASRVSATTFFTRNKIANSWLEKRDSKSQNPSFLSKNNFAKSCPFVSLADRIGLPIRPPRKNRVEQFCPTKT